MHSEKISSRLSFGLMWLLNTICVVGAAGPDVKVGGVGGVGGAALPDGAKSRRKSGLSEVRNGTVATGAFLAGPGRIPGEMGGRPLLVPMALADLDLPMPTHSSSELVPSSSSGKLPFAGSGV